MATSSWSILVEETADGKTTARVLGLADFEATAETQQAAIEQIRHLLAERLVHAKLVSIEVPAALSQPDHPLLKSAGIFKDDPHFEDVQHHIQAYRQELDVLEDGENTLP